MGEVQRFTCSNSNSKRRISTRRQGDSRPNDQTSNDDTIWHLGDESALAETCLRISNSRSTHAEIIYILSSCALSQACKAIQGNEHLVSVTFEPSLNLFVPSDEEHELLNLVFTRNWRKLVEDILEQKTVRWG
eukprot:983423_1